jgi:Mrr N-terminal domain
MAIPDFQSIFKPLLEYAAEQEVVVMSSAIEEMRVRFKLSEADFGKKNSGGTPTFRNRVHWARQYLVFAGLLEPHRRGCVQITRLGREWCRKKGAGFKISDLKTIPAFNERVRPRAFQTKVGQTTVQVTIPGIDEPEQTEKAPTEHTEIQWLLLKLGVDMSFDVWVARNDRNRSFKGNSFATLPCLKEELPVKFDDATKSTIELIDVLWLKGNAIVAAFEIESTTSIYSGLLRMADLLAMQPNINIPLYLVAPKERRAKVMTEVNRPTFSRLSPPLAGICRYIAFDGLRDRIKQAAAFIKFLKPEFLEELSESCKIDD